MHFLHGALSLAFSFTSLSGILVVVTTGLIAAVVVWTVKLLLRHAYYTHRLSCFSMPPVHSWLVGHLGQMQSTEEGLQQVDELVKTYKHSCSWFFGPFYHLVRIFHPDYVKPLLMAPGNITVKDDLVYNHLRPWLGHSLLISNGKEWARKRRLLTPAFHFDILKNYITTFNTSTNTMHEKWRSMLTDGKTNIEMFNDVTLMTLDSLLKCAFSYNSNCQESTSEYVSAIVELSDLILNRRLRIWHHWDWIYWRTQQGRRFKKALSIVHRFTREVVQKRRTIINHQRMTESQPDLSTAGQRRKDFVDIILSSKDEDGQGLTNEEVEAEANTFMFAGRICPTFPSPPCASERVSGSTLLCRLLPGNTPRICFYQGIELCQRVSSVWSVFMEHTTTPLSGQTLTNFILCVLTQITHQVDQLLPSSHFLQVQGTVLARNLPLQSYELL
ncbi:cytochrome P450 4F3 isoform X4 [Sphaeramia orbicularis]|uniref:cytochrome P450 4F3 isoform X4 n=1 Tax=Sphaeramia orbicularis TaxID=375764 RepID=UPI0011810E51|nr:docosahexaenoic acid omega-hydroxylase CYP4F3-like isoform X4 [Sphaeramia orbicularis]